MTVHLWGSKHGIPASSYIGQHQNNRSFYKMAFNQPKKYPEISERIKSTQKVSGNIWKMQSSFQLYWGAAAASIYDIKSTVDWNRKGKSSQKVPGNMRNECICSKVSWQIYVLVEMLADILGSTALPQFPSKAFNQLCNSASPQILIIDNPARQLLIPIWYSPSL